MISKSYRLIGPFVIVFTAALAGAQTHNLSNTLDSGTRSAGLGSALSSTDAEPLSAINNPAGLGYLSAREFSITYRNLPGSTSTATDLAGGRANGSGFRGSTSLTSLAFSIPLISKKGPAGTLGFSYSVGGFFSDDSQATSLAYNTATHLVANAFKENRSMKTEFFTLGYGKTLESQNLSVGVGLTMAKNKLDYSQSFTVVDSSTNSSVSSQATNSDGTSYGLGVIVGAQYNPPKLTNHSIGISYRTPISLNSGNGTTSYFDRIPGRLLLGDVVRFMGPKGRSSDYVVVAAQAEAYSGGSSSDLFAQNAKTVYEAGAEYGFSSDFGRLPIRLGYRSIPAGGPGLSDWSGFTYGIGFRDPDNRISLDLTLASPSGGPSDFAITATYRFNRS